MIPIFFSSSSIWSFDIDIFQDIFDGLPAEFALSNVISYDDDNSALVSS